MHQLHKNKYENFLTFDFALPQLNVEVTSHSSPSSYPKPRIPQHSTFTPIPTTPRQFFPTSIHTHLSVTSRARDPHPYVAVVVAPRASPSIERRTARANSISSLPLPPSRSCLERRCERSLRGGVRARTRINTRPPPPHVDRARAASPVARDERPSDAAAPAGSNARTLARVRLLAPASPRDI